MKKTRGRYNESPQVPVLRKHTGLIGARHRVLSRLDWSEPLRAPGHMPVAISIRCVLSHRTLLYQMHLLVEEDLISESGFVIYHPDFRLIVAVKIYLFEINIFQAELQVAWKSIIIHARLTHGIDRLVIERDSTMMVGWM